MAGDPARAAEAFERLQHDKDPEVAALRQALDPYLDQTVHILRDVADLVAGYAKTQVRKRKLPFEIPLLRDKQARLLKVLDQLAARITTLAIPPSTGHVKDMLNFFNEQLVAARLRLDFPMAEAPGVQDAAATPSLAKIYRHAVAHFNVIIAAAPHMRHLNPAVAAHVVEAWQWAQQLVEIAEVTAVLKAQSELVAQVKKSAADLLTILVTKERVPWPAAVVREPVQDTRSIRWLVVLDEVADFVAEELRYLEALEPMIRVAPTMAVLWLQPYLQILYERAPRFYRSMKGDHAEDEDVTRAMYSLLGVIRYARRLYAWALAQPELPVPVPAPPPGNVIVPAVVAPAVIVPAAVAPVIVAPAVIAPAAVVPVAADYTPIVRFVQDELSHLLHVAPILVVNDDVRVRQLAVMVRALPLDGATRAMLDALFTQVYIRLDALIGQDVDDDAFYSFSDDDASVSDDDSDDDIAAPVPVPAGGGYVAPPRDTWLKAIFAVPPPWQPPEYAQRGPASRWMPNTHPGREFLRLESQAAHVKTVTGEVVATFV